MPPQCQAAFALLEPFLLDDAAHVGRQAFEPILIVGFDDFAHGLLLVEVAGIAQPKQAGMLGPLRFRQGCQKFQLRLVKLIKRVPGLERVFHTLK